jgi:transcriptional regulator with XRE-family HTH domain
MGSVLRRSTGSHDETELSVVSLNLHSVALTCLETDITLWGMATEPAIGTLIKRARERKRWTQRQLADALHVNIKSVDNWENGRTSPRSSIGALEEVLGVSLDGAPAPQEDLVPTDEWEQSVLDDPYLPDEDKRWLIENSRAARAEAVRVRRERRARDAARSEGQAEGLSGRGTAAG